MELTDSTDGPLQLGHDPNSNSNSNLTDNRSPLGIDLNEIPSSSHAETLPAAFDVVRSFHENLVPAPGNPAELPGVGDEERDCGACGRPEVRGHVVVCDSCERGFHLGCTGMQGRRPMNQEEWVCGECVNCGVRSKRWPLGVKSKRILDINASPPSDGDAEGEDVQELRMHTLDDNSFGGNPVGAPVTYSNLLYVGNGFGFQKAHGMYHTQNACRSIEEVDMGFNIGRIRSGNNSAIRLSSQNPNEIYLEALRDFIFERHGVLEEGWHVEFKQSAGSGGLCAVYCAPDGKTFDSMFEVTCYLGLTSNCRNMESEMRCGALPFQEKLCLRKKRKPTRFSIANGFTENRELKELSSNGQNMENFDRKSGNVVEVKESWAEENDGKEVQQHNGGLPVQFEDFFVLSLGLVDVRPSYHDVAIIFPVGYRSCWHDKITGSLFTCEVSDGGDSGPVFKVKRCSCSACPIPNASTVLFRSSQDQFDGQNGQESSDMTYSNMNYDNDDSIQMIISDPCPPLDNDILSCLGCSLNEACEFQTSNSRQYDTRFVYDGSGNLLADNFGLKDEIGDILVEDRSSSSAWRLMSQKFIDTCSEIFRGTGSLEFFCKHVENEMGSPNWDVRDSKSKDNFTVSAKFCGSPCSLSIPSVIRGDNGLDSLSDALKKWLDQDRFGLDAEFVQEIIEQLPKVPACSRYEFLNTRSYYSSSLMVGNGLLVAKKKNGGQEEEEDLDGLFRTKKARLIEDHVMGDRCPPPGKPLCLRLPLELVGDVYQAWETLWRFHEVLGLIEPFSLEELEEELIHPWFDCSRLLQKFEKEIQGTQVLNFHRKDVPGQISLTSSEFGPIVSGEELAIIEIKTGAMKEAAQARLSSVTDSGCSGVVLTKAHKSLLRVLISELQSKVAVLVDPNFDTGESKSKRGKKKDTNCSIHAKRTKLIMLPINELTWPELARRYILSVLSMDGNLDSAEITTRESGKVFRCLQGDGGVLCGSLTGVAGMEADALLLAEATKQIFCSLNRENDVITLEDEGSDATDTCEKSLVHDGSVLEWAKLLEPVRKLPTNVGTRIRKCVYDALNKGPPEWAKEILEHSISKEVYKGNASGPTKKLVLSVLADVRSKGLTQKSDEGSKRKIVISISDIIMKKCRIVLRRSASDDDTKVFCTLLGRKLINSNDNDDEGLLGYPAMVSRPLDFRTIDLRLAVGAYGGSHDAFLEDVRELWNNVRSAYGDQPDLVELANTLSQNFESLYEKEVVPLVQKFVQYAKLERINAETKKEIDEFLVSTSGIPKAPWDEGVCKVCGIDKDDDSVLLCDTCDAEYHTYCLNPPLARIPEGNWYCPSCVVGRCMVQDTLECTQVVDRIRRKIYQGEVTRVYLEALTHLTSVMEEKEYWELCVDERTFLLKFLCDELLNSALIRQHLEQCAEASVELQQKLRSLSVEWKTLKSREEILAARVAKLDASMLNAVGEVGLKEGLATSLTNHGKCMGQPQTLSDRLNQNVFIDDLPPLECGQEGTHRFGKCPPVTHINENSTCNSQNMDPADTEVQSEVLAVVGDTKVPGNLSSNLVSQENEKSDKSFRPKELPSSNPLPQETDDSRRETDFQGNLQECTDNDSSTLVPSDDNKLCLQSSMTSRDVSPHVPPVAVNESQAYHLELNSIKKDLSLRQDAITNAESQLLKLSIRREFLGSDSGNRLYWASSPTDGQPRIIVDGSLVVRQRKKIKDLKDPVHNVSKFQNSASSGMDTSLTLEGSKACCPYLYDPSGAMTSCSAWLTYQADTEIEELIGWLKEDDQKERELKESILHWKRLRSQDPQQTRRKGQDRLQTNLSVSKNIEKTASSSSLVTKAATFLEKKYGPCCGLDTADILKKRGKKARLTNVEKMYRCECLEPIWPCRHHCLSCHITFSTDTELEGHNDGPCSSRPSAYEKSKEMGDFLKGQGNMKNTSHGECAGDLDVIEFSKNRGSELGLRLINFQNEGLPCPYNFEEISSRFVTRDSKKELVQEIGLIGLNGIPSFVPSTSPYLSDSTLMLIPPRKDVGDQGDKPEAVEIPVIPQYNSSITNAVQDNKSENYPRKSAANGIGEVLKPDRPGSRILLQKDRKSSFDNHYADLGVDHFCVVPQSSLRPLVGKVPQILRQLKINLLDMDAALPQEGLRPSKAHLERRCAWRAFVKSAKTIYEMIQATIVLEDMIKTEYLRNEWWYWSSLSVAAKTSNVSSLALRIYSLDAAIVYEKAVSDSDLTDNSKPSSILDPKLIPSLDLNEKSKVSRKTNKKRKEPEVDLANI